MPRYTSKSEFMHDFVSGATTQVSSKNVTSTYLRAKRRQEAKADDWASRQIRSQKQVDADDREQKREWRNTEILGRKLNRIADRIQKQNPGMSHIKARIQARKHDPVGRKIAEMREKGYPDSEIVKKLRRGGKASSGRSSG